MSFGLSACSLTCEDYQLLINRGWRRSGGFSVVLRCLILSRLKRSG